MLMDSNTIAAETGGVEYLQDSSATALAPIRPSHESRTFDLPKSIWWTMFLAYAVFFLAITIATGRDRSALFMIVISGSYAVMYFGTATVMNAVGVHDRPATVPGVIQTATGKLSYGAAFACAIAVVKAIVAP
jgi:hypothetical protein